MQLYALEDFTPIGAHVAKRGKNYFCPECRGPVRARGGDLRQIHFYHLATLKHCRQNKKSIEHLQLQLKILDLIGESEAKIECAFPSIQRIADVAWHKKKIVFEVQCSSISFQEAESRNRDYLSIGYRVIWILHERQFNKKNVSASENYLRSTPCYFTNIDKCANGQVYDQFEVIKGNRRLFKGPKLSLSITEIHILPKTEPPDIEIPKILMNRLKTWGCYAKKDLLHRWLQERNLVNIANPMVALEKRLLKEFEPLKRLPLGTLICKSYRFLLEALLKKL